MRPAKIGDYAVTLHGCTKATHFFVLNAGVQVIWHVLPALRMVRVFASVKSDTTHFETDTFDATPVVPDLQMTVDELFAR